MRTRTHKVCPACNETLPIHAYGRNRQAKDGLHYYCKACAAARQRTWAKAHPEKVRAMRADYLRRVRAQNEGRDPYAVA
jgi:transposase-like protein